MLLYVTAATTFHELFEFANSAITAEGFENLDFLGNVGHSIAARLDDRIYIQAGNHRRLGDSSLFTFEPHIRKVGGPWGFKHENVYRIRPDGRAEEI
jgi:hypothetical protein